MDRVKKRILSFTLALVLVLSFDFSAVVAEKSKDYGKPPKELSEMTQEE